MTPQHKGMSMMNMIKKLMLTLILGMIISGPAAPLFKTFVGFGSTAAYAGNDNSQGNSTSQGEDGDGDFDGQ
jgi:hypothetical protein